MQVKIVLGVVAHQLGNAGDGQVRGDEQVLGLADAAAEQILPGRDAAGFLEGVGQIVGTHMEGLPNLLQGQRLGVVLVDILLDPQTQGALLRLDTLTVRRGAREVEDTAQQGQQQMVTEGLAAGRVGGEVAVHHVVKGPEVFALCAHMVDGGGIVGKDGARPERRQAQPRKGYAAAVNGAVGSGGELVVDHAAVEQQQIAALHVVGLFPDEEAAVAAADEHGLRKVRMGVQQAGTSLVKGGAAADIEQFGHIFRCKHRLEIPLDEALYLQVGHETTPFQ